MRKDNYPGIRAASVKRVIQLHKRGDNCVGAACIRGMATATSVGSAALRHIRLLNLKLSRRKT